MRLLLRTGFLAGLAGGVLLGSERFAVAGVVVFFAAAAGVLVAGAGETGVTGAATDAGCGAGVVFLAVPAVFLLEFVARTL